MYTSARAFGYLLFSVSYQGLDSGLCYTVLNFAVLIFLLFELNFASSKNLFFGELSSCFIISEKGACFALLDCSRKNILYHYYVKWNAR